MIDEADTVITAGQKVLLMGESGTGKSTLIRAIAGLWPWGSGAVRLPAGAKIAFLPQRPYMPLGTLRQVLCYPDDWRNSHRSDLTARADSLWAAATDPAYG